MFLQEWAVLSFQRRGNRDAKERRETPTQEKHRFRNALARANGIVYRKDIKVDGARVYQFIGKKQKNKICSSFSAFVKKAVLFAKKYFWLNFWLITLCRYGFCRFVRFVGMTFG